MSIWALAMAYKKNADLDEDRAKGYELDQVGLYDQTFDVFHNMI